MNSSDLEPNALFTTNGKDIWKLKIYCTEPTCTLENLEHPDRVENFGLGGLTAQGFHRIIMPKLEKEND